MNAVMEVPMAERDGRVMNAMAPEMKLVHARLERWGHWAKAQDLRAWPEKTLLKRIMEAGPDGALIRSVSSTHIPEDIAQVDAAIAHLGAVDKRVIRRYYLEWAPIEAMVGSLRMRAGEFRAVLNRARWRISSYLAASEKI